MCVCVLCSEFGVGWISGSGSLRKGALCGLSMCFSPCGSIGSRKKREGKGGYRARRPSVERRVVVVVVGISGGWRARRVSLLWMRSAAALPSLVVVARCPNGVDLLEARARLERAETHAGRDVGNSQKLRER